MYLPKFVGNGWGSPRLAFPDNRLKMLNRGLAERPRAYGAQPFFAGIALAWAAKPWAGVIPGSLLLPTQEDCGG